MAVGNGEMEFKIFCSNKDMDGSIIKGVAFDEWVPYNANTNIWYSSTNIILPVLKQEIKKEKPDYLFIVGIYDWQYNFKPLLFCKGIKKIISVRGMLHPGALSQKGFKKKIYLGLWKMLGLHKGKAVGSGQRAVGSGQLAVGKGQRAVGSWQWATVFHATDEAEKNYIQQVFGNSVNVNIAANFPNVLELQPVVQKEPGQLNLISIALISPMKNMLLVLEALGEGSREEGGGRRESGVGRRESLVGLITYNIYGPIKDRQYWEACEAQIKKLPHHITVNYHGDLRPDKIVDALAANHVFILPSKSENYGHAIYEALSAGRPVITSHTTPWNNLQTAKAGINVSLTDKTEMVNAIERFAAMKPEELETWSKGARVYAVGAVDVEEIRRQYEEMFG